MFKVLINCSNLHVGGGVAVATSFIDCLSKKDNIDLDISLLLSSEVKANLDALDTDYCAFANVTVFDVYGIGSFFAGFKYIFENYELVFTVFGPVYFLGASRTLHLVGFAQPNIIYPSRLKLTKDFLYSFGYRVKYKLQEFFFSRANALVVELEHVRNALRNKRIFAKTPVYIVHSAVHSIFLNSLKWQEVPLSRRRGAELRFGLISRNYPHKNLTILPQVKRILLREFGIESDFFVTFTQSEWLECTDDFRANIINVGGLSLSQCPSFYAQLDGVVFPSLLECFSAVPIEAMTVGRPLFASNLPFIRDVCGDYCNYFDPTDPRDIAEAIAGYFSKDLTFRAEWEASAAEYVSKFTDPYARADAYIDLIRSMLK